MSWGERSCIYYANGCPMKNVTMSTCTVYCPAYKFNGNKPDTELGSIPSERNKDIKVYTIPTKKAIKRLKKKGKLK